MRTQTTHTGSWKEHEVNIDVYAYIFRLRAFSGILITAACCIFTSNDKLVIARGLLSLTQKHFNISRCVKLTTANHVVVASTYRDAKVNILI